MTTQKDELGKDGSEGVYVQLRIQTHAIYSQHSSTPWRSWSSSSKCEKSCNRTPENHSLLSVPSIQSGQLH